VSVNIGQTRNAAHCICVNNKVLTKRTLRTKTSAI
jgi:hypothetical protein